MTNLSDFDAGVPEDDPNPEDNVKTYLSEWLRGDNRTIYWERDKTYGNGTFEITTHRRLDLVIASTENNYAVEVKRGQNGSRIYDGAMQALTYWRDLVEGRATYTIRGEDIEIDAVLLATAFSPEGHLFDTATKKDVMRSERSEGGQRAAEAGHIPTIEYNASETLIRMVHRYAKEAAPNATVGIGGLLSSALDGDQPNISSADPAALFYTSGGEYVQQWQYIPFYLDS